MSQVIGRKNTKATLFVLSTDLTEGEIVTLGHTEDGTPVVVGFDNIAWTKAETKALVAGKMLCQTPHTALGSYADRSKGIVAAANIRLPLTSKRWNTLAEQLTTDARFDFEYGNNLLSEFETEYKVR